MINRKHGLKRFTTRATLLTLGSIKINQGFGADTIPGAPEHGGGGRNVNILLCAGQFYLKKMPGANTTHIRNTTPSMFP